MVSPIFFLSRPTLHYFSVRPIFAIGLGSAALLASQTVFNPQRRRVLLCEGNNAFSNAGSRVAEGLDQYSKDAKVPVMKRGRMNPAAVRQISGGSILGTLYNR